MEKIIVVLRRKAPSELFRQLSEVCFLAKVPNQLLVGHKKGLQVFLKLSDTLRNGTQEKLFVGQQLHPSQPQLQFSITRSLMLQSVEGKANRADAFLHKQFIAEEDFYQVLDSVPAFVIWTQDIK